MNEPHDEHTGPRTAQVPSRIQLAGLTAITLIGASLCSMLTVPFLPALTWASVLAVLFAPLCRRMTRLLRNPNLAATGTVTLVGLIVIMPALVIGGLIAREVSRGAQTIKARLESGEWLRAIEANSVSASLAGWLRDVDLPAALANAAAWITNASATLIGASVGHVITLLLTFYFLFYFLRDRSIILNLLCNLSPLMEGETKQLFRRVSDTIYATIYGTGTVAAVQGVLSGLMFWWLDLPAPLLWGVVMGLLAIVPVLGAFVVWVPAAAFLTLDGSWGKALVLTLWGTVIVGGIDNLLYPILVGKRLRLHTVPAFIAIVGGVVLFGASGLVLGPISVTATVFLATTLRTRIAQMGQNRNRPGDLDRPVGATDPDPSARSP